MLRFICGALLIAAAVMTTTLPAAADPGDTTAALQARAARQRLAASPEWRALLHYEKNWLRGGVHSTVVSPDFFLAPGGATDPAAELDATIARLFSAQPVGAGDQPAFCRFVARRRFLTARLHINAARLPVTRCPAYRRWRRALAPERISLVFATAFSNSPASMFGHTLLRIDSSQQARATELLAYAVNFAASAGDDGHGLGFAWKGLTGGYPGVFGLFAYYDKVKQYAWIEHRDVWSWPLKLKPDEIERLVDHLWEMDGVKFDYYFLIKNCSYQLLSLLDVARPSLELTRRYAWYAIPVDTIRTVASVPGLLGKPAFRASLETTLRRRANRLAPRLRDLAVGVATGRIARNDPRVAALSNAERAAVLEVAHDYLYFRIQTGAATSDAAPDRADALLRARSRIARASPFAPVPAPATPPDRGHRTLRVAANSVYQDKHGSLGFRIRPAYHDLLDDPGGYTAGEGIEFLDLRLRVDPARAVVRLADFTLFSVESISPRSALFDPLSYRIDTGLRRRPAAAVFTDERNGLGYYLQGGPGLAWGHDHLLGYVYGLGSVDANPSLQRGYAVGAGARAGMLGYPRRGWQLRLEVGALEYVGGASGFERWARVAQQIGLMRGLALRGEVGWQATAAEGGLRAVLGFNAYF